MSSLICWQALLRAVRSARGGPEPSALARQSVAEFRRTGQRPRRGWLRCWLDHEQPDQPWTYGPRTPAEVDWTAFQVDERAEHDSHPGDLA